MNHPNTMKPNKTKPNNTKKVLLNGFLLLFTLNVFAEVKLDEQRPDDLTTVQWQDLKSAFVQTKVQSNDGNSNRGTAVALDPNSDRAVVGNWYNSDNGEFAGSATVFELIQGNWVEQTQLKPLDGAAAQRFGAAVDFYGDWLAIGAPAINNQPGAVYLYHFNGSQWQMQQKLTASQTTSGNNYFGYDVEMVGDRLVVGEYQGSPNNLTHAGAVYVYDLDVNNSTWVLSQKLIAADGTTSDYFGFSVSLSNDATELAVGAFGRDDLGSRSGAVYMFQETAGVWQQVDKILGSNITDNDVFGYKVALDQGLLLVTTTFNSESVYVFQYINENWVETQVLTSPTSSLGFGFHIDVIGDKAYISESEAETVLIYDLNAGNWVLEQTLSSGDPYAIDLIGDRLIVGIYSGAKYYKYLPDVLPPVTPLRGSTCSLPPCSWVEQSTLVSSDTGADDGFGVAIDVAGNRAVIGAYQDDDKGTNAGAAYVFEWGETINSGLKWHQVKKLTASDGAAGDAFGRSVAIDGDRVIVGAYQDDYSINMFANENAGSVYVFDFDGSFWHETEKLVAGETVPNLANDLFGFTIDLDGDRIAIGAHKDDENGMDAGAVYVFDLDVINGWQKTTKLMPINAEAGDAFGYALSLDGEKILAGAYLDDDVAINAGAAYVFEHVINPNFEFWNEQDKLLPLNGSAADFFGTAVSLDGGQAVVGAYSSSNASFPLIENTGKAYFFEINGSNWNLLNAVIASDAAFDDRFGYSVNLKGNRALIGSWFDDDLGEDSGSVYIFKPDPMTALWTETEKLTASDGNSNDYFGVAVAQTADWMLIGAHRNDESFLNSGAVYLFNDDVIFKNDFESTAGGL